MHLYMYMVEMVGVYAQLACLIWHQSILEKNRVGLWVWVGLLVFFFLGNSGIGSAPHTNTFLANNQLVLFMFLARFLSLSRSHHYPYIQLLFRGEPAPG